MSICLALLLASLFALVIGAPVALLVPVLLSVVVDVPEDVWTPPAPVAVTAESRSATCAPAVRVYAARGPRDSRPASAPSCDVRPSLAGTPLGANGRPLVGAARVARLAKVGATYCRTVRLWLASSESPTNT